MGASALPQTSASRPSGDTQRTTVSPKAEAAAERARFDGDYQGRFCNTNEGREGITRCWRAVLNVQQGKLYSTWTSRFSKNPVYAKGSIAPDGSANLVIDGFRQDGTPQRATMAGSLASDKITLSGNWRNGVVINASLTRIR
jgi:hypothetical protein